MTAIGIGIACLVAFVWLLCIGANITHNQDLVERDNPNAED